MKKFKLLVAVTMCLGLSFHAFAQQNILKYIKVYFTQPVSTGYSTTGVDAVQLPNTIFDTLARYIDRAKYTIDIAQYEYEANDPTEDSIYVALNKAYTRGVKIRYIEDYSETVAGNNTGVALLTSSIPVLESPKQGNTACHGEDYNIMHNKFVIIDEYATDSTKSIVWTGSPDWDNDMSLGDYNNVIIFQSKVLARAYTNEFDIMWGDTTHGGATDASTSKFGACKPNSGTHIFHIGGSEVELYFSPSDYVNSEIVEKIHTAKTDLYCGMFTFTETTDANDIVDEKDDGVLSYAILDNYSSGSYTPYTTIFPDSLGTNFTGYVNGTYLYHNKYLIVNPSAPCDDPLVLTGSHNWTASADTENDENTVIVHNDTIANIYLQAFASDFKAISGNSVTKLTNPCPVVTTFTVSTDVTANTTECASKGSATATATGGTTPYTYSWSPSGGTKATATGLSGGTYTITVKDVGGGSVTASVVITQPATLTATGNITANVTCHGDDNGTTSSTVSGGLTPYTYSWTGGGGSKSTATGLSAGTYTLTVTDNNDCTSSSTVIITQPASLTATASSTNITCHGDDNGTTSSTVSGGTSPYTYTWTGGGTTSTVSSLSAGTYTVSVKDNNGCTSSATTTITQPANALSVSASTTANATCTTEGSASSATSGGTSPYTYSWSSGGGTKSTATGLAAGTYTVSVTDNNGCTGSATTTITQSSTLNVSANTTANITCHGDDNGSTSSTVSGGASPYTYSWSGGEGSKSTATGLSAGAYTLTVTDNSGCTSSVTITVTQPTTLSATASSTNVACHGDNNGTVSSTVSGGTSPYTYAWTGGGSSPTVSGLSAGNYTVNVEDNNGCTSSATTTITQPANALSVSATTTANLSCGTTGSATSTTSGGTSPYTYSWSSGGGTKSTATGLAAGTYTISVTDNNGCTNSAITTITQSAGSLSVSATVTANVSCNGGTTGSASSNVSGGTAPYTYSWTGGAGTNPTASGLSAKTYTLNVTDNSGCTGLAVITITQPAILGASATTTANVSCNGVHSGSASSTVSGGTAPYTYSWTGGAGNSSTANGLSAGNYTLTVTDACGASLSATVIITQPNSLDVSANTTAGVSCNGAHTGSTSSTVSGGTSPYTYSWSGGGGNNSTANGLGAGTYTLTVMDACGASLSTTTVITQPASLDVSANTTANVVCYGGSTGSATSAATGGTSPYNYSWSPSGGNNSTANNLSAGTYVLTVTDACGASSTSSVSVSQPATAINVTTSSTNATGTNSNGTATATVSGGNAPYTYLWTPGSETSGTITGLSAGSYCCDVTDANGCSQSTCVTVTSSTGISNITNATSIRIYPDPTNGYFTVAGVTQGQVIELYNYMGQELSNETVSNNTTLHFDITNRANGIYLIRILNTDGSLASEKKMIKTQ